MILLIVAAQAAETTALRSDEEMVATAHALFADLHEEGDPPDDFTFLTSDEALQIDWDVYDWTDYDRDAVAYCNAITTDSELDMPTATAGWTQRAAAGQLTQVAIPHLDMLELDFVSRTVFSLKVDVNEGLQAFEDARLRMQAIARGFLNRSDVLTQISIGYHDGSTPEVLSDFDRRETCLDLYSEAKGTLIQSSAIAKSEFAAQRVRMAEGHAFDVHQHTIGEDFLNEVNNSGSVLEPIGQ